MQSTLPSELSLTQRTGSLQESLAGKVLLVVGATAFVAACAHISFPLPFTPVPLTLQNFAVLLVGMALGPVAGFSAMVLYLLEGAIGLPVFTPYAAGGVAHLLGASGGFLFSYPLAAAAAGLTVRAVQPLTTRFRGASLRPSSQPFLSSCSARVGFPTTLITAHPQRGPSPSLPSSQAKSLRSRQQPASTAPSIAGGRHNRKP